MKLSGNTILITGGTSGIGLELAKKLLQKGNKVIVTGRSDSKIADAKKILPQLHVIKNDVGLASEIENLVNTVKKDFPDLNILINNAGIMQELNLHDESLTDNQLVGELHTNLLGPIRLSHRLIPHLKQKSESAIVNVSSGLAFVPLPISPVYSATKAGLNSFTRSLRAQLKPTSIRVFELAPPATETPLLANANESDMKGITVMSVEALVDAALKGMENDVYEIRPGQSNQLKWMNRIAPEFIFSQLSRTLDRILPPSKTK